MAVIKSAGVASFIRHIPADMICVLIYGEDAGAVRETATAIVTAAAGSADDPFNVARLTEQQLSQDAGRLPDEFGAISLMGGRRAVWVSDSGAAFLKALEPIMEAGRPGGLIVAESGTLAKASRLRIICESSQQAAAIPIYSESEQDLAGIIADAIRSAGLTIGADARLLLQQSLSGGRLDTRQQLAKLLAFCLGQKEITVADVEACCSDTREADIDRFVDSALDGDLAQTELQYSKLIASGMSGTRLLSSAAFGVGRLQRLRARVERGDSVETVVRAARPPVFFGRQATVSRQLHLWDGQGLASVASSLSSAILQCRERPALEDAIASRAFLSTARAARALRSSH